MDSFELNKIAGGILGTLLVVLGMGFLAESLFHHKKLEKPGFEIAVVEKASSAVAAEPSKPIAELLATASVEKGQSIAKQCISCHSFEKGAANKVGPALYGILDRAKGSVAGFNYSAALKAKGGAWTYDDLAAFMQSPKGYVAGTTMAYAGLSKASDRADVILYLRSLSDAPIALPK